MAFYLLHNYMDFILRLMKPWDYFIITAVIMASFVPYLLFDTNNDENNNRESTDVIAVVKIDGEVVDKFNLSQVNESFEKTYYPQKGKYNIIEVAPGKIRVKEDNSPDQIAVRTGWISRPGEMSRCLPHKLIVEILGVEENPLIY